MKNLHLPSITRLPLVTLVGFALALPFAPAALQAQTVSTIPVGAVSLTINPGTGTTRSLTVVSVPLVMNSVATGQMSGVITSVAANSLTNTNAAWTAGALSAAATPYVLKITSGAAKGRTFLLSTTTANTATAVTLDSTETTDLTTLSIVAGTDTYDIYAVDTLSTLLPLSTGVLAGATMATADNVLLNDGGIWTTYWYKTNVGWVRGAFGVAATNTVLKPDSAILYNRLSSSAMAITIVGTVPKVDRKTLVNNSGLTFAAAGWPVDRSVSALGLETLPGFVSGANLNASDQVLINKNGSWVKYFYNGSSWRKGAFGTAIDATDIVPSGSGILIVKQGSSTGASVLAQALPYSL